MGALYLKRKEKKTKHQTLLVELVQAQRSGGDVPTLPAFFPHPWHRTPVNPAVTDNVQITVGNRGPAFL